MSHLDPKEQVGRVTEPSHQDMQPIPQTILSEHHVSSLVEEAEPLDTNPVDVNVDVDAPIIETVEIVRKETGEVQGYALPPRSTRGVPPKRYGPGYEARRSRYPIEAPREGNIS